MADKERTTHVMTKGVERFQLRELWMGVMSWTTSELAELGKTREADK